MFIAIANSNQLIKTVILAYKLLTIIEHIIKLLLLLNLTVICVLLVIAIV